MRRLVFDSCYKSLNTANPHRQARITIDEMNLISTMDSNGSFPITILKASKKDLIKPLQIPFPGFLCMQQTPPNNKTKYDALSIKEEAEQILKMTSSILPNSHVCKVIERALRMKADYLPRRKLFTNMQYGFRERSCLPQQLEHHGWVPK